MAGDKAVALALLANQDLMIQDLEDRFGPGGIALRDRVRTAADAENVGNYIIQDLRDEYAKLLIRVNAMQDSA